MTQRNHFCPVTNELYVEVSLPVTDLCQVALFSGLVRKFDILRSIECEEDSHSL